MDGWDKLFKVPLAVKGKKRNVTGSNHTPLIYKQEWLVFPVRCAPQWQAKVKQTKSIKAVASALTESHAAHRRLWFSGIKQLPLSAWPVLCGSKMLQFFSCVTQRSRETLAGWTAEDQQQFVPFLGAFRKNLPLKSCIYYLEVSLPFFYYNLLRYISMFWLLCTFGP